MHGYNNFKVSFIKSQNSFNLALFTYITSYKWGNGELILMLYITAVLLFI